MTQTQVRLLTLDLTKLNLTLTLTPMTLYFTQTSAFLPFDLE